MFTMCHFKLPKIPFLGKVKYCIIILCVITFVYNYNYLTKAKLPFLLCKCLCMMGLYASLSAGASFFFFCCLSSHGIGLKVVCVVGQARWEFVACPLVTNVVTLGSDYMQNKPLNRKLVLMQIWLTGLEKQRENWTNCLLLFGMMMRVLYALTAGNIYNKCRKKTISFIFSFSLNCISLLPLWLSPHLSVVLNEVRWKWEQFKCHF